MSPEGGRLDRMSSRVRAEATARVEQVRSAARTAARGLRTAIIVSALAALIAWLVLFGVRIGSGTPWVLSGLVVLCVLLTPAASLWYLRRQFMFITTLPNQLGEIYAEVAETADPTELKAHFDELSGKGGLRLALAIGSLVRWARAQIGVPTATAATAQLRRMLATVPLATAVGVVGTIAVMLLIPVFAVASGVLVLT